MAKKSKAERNAIRKEGWKEAGQGLHEMYGKSSLDAIAAMGKGFTKGVSSGRSSKNQPIRENMIGKGIAGLGGAIVEGFKNIPNTIKTMAKGNWKLIKGVFKGIFNHPDWWAYRNVLSVPAYNENRPFDAVALKSISGTVPSTPGIGVTHVVKQNVFFSDMRNSESFQLAMIEAFKDIRLMLKSNLPYTQEIYNNFISVAMSICAKAKAIERVLGWYNVTRPDIPELQKAVLSVTSNTNELGKVTPMAINMIDGNNYASTLNKYNKLKSIVSNIAIPQKLSEYISWWLASVFIDQSAPNAQLYINELRDVPVYGVDSNNDIVITKKWDIATGSIDDVIDEALMLLNVFGIMNADITKTNKYGLITLASVEKGAYTPITLCDPEFFTILINNYIQDRDDILNLALFNREYIRIDALEDLGPSNLIGVTNALANWAKTVVPFAIKSQCAYIVNDSSFRSGRNFDYQGSPTGTVFVNQYVQASGDYWYQIAGNIDADVKTVITPTATSLTNTFTFSSKYNGTGIGTISSMSLLLKTTTFHYSELNTFSGTIVYQLGPGSSGSYNFIKLTLASGVVTGVAISRYSSQIPNGTKNPTGLTDLVALTSGTDFSVTSTSFGSIVYSTINVLGTNVTIAAAARTYMLALFTVGSSPTEDATNLLNSISVSETTTSTTFKLQGINAPLYESFGELVDYHIPFIMRQNLRVSDGTNGVFSYGIPMLVKQTYIPLIFNFSDVEAVLYWMYLGLFSID